jgi:hypothetical protein
MTLKDKDPNMKEDKSFPFILFQHYVIVSVADFWNELCYLVLLGPKKWLHRKC